jgi:hypothetical protein
MAISDQASAIGISEIRLIADSRSLIADGEFVSGFAD